MVGVDSSVALALDFLFPFAASLPVKHFDLEVAVPPFALATD